MNTIKVVYERERVLLDENNEVISYEMLPEHVKILFFSGMNGNHMEDYQEEYDSYHEKLDLEIQELSKGTPFYEDPKVVYQERRFVTACYLKEALPDTKVMFKNNNYYDLPVDGDGFSEIPENFDISTMVLSKGEKVLKVMFDWESTGIWDYEGKSISIGWVPASQATRSLITQFQRGMNSMRIDYDNNYTEEEKAEVDKYLLLGLKGAIELKKELPDWKIYFYNDGQYFDLPVNPKGDQYSRCSEIRSDLVAENVKINREKRFFQ